TSGLANPTHKYFNTPQTTYNVKLVVTDANGCMDSVLKPAYVNFVNTVANFQAPATACVGEAITFTNTTTPCISTSKWLFDMPTGDTSTAINPTYSYSTDGTKTIRMITNCGLCPDTVIKQITVYPKPVVD